MLPSISSFQELEEGKHIRAAALREHKAAKLFSHTNSSFALFKLLQSSDEAFLKSQRNLAPITCHNKRSWREVFLPRVSFIVKSTHPEEETLSSWVTWRRCGNVISILICFRLWISVESRCWGLWVVAMALRLLAEKSCVCCGQPAASCENIKQTVTNIFIALTLLVRKIQKEREKRLFRGRKNRQAKVHCWKLRAVKFVFFPFCPHVLQAGNQQAEPLFPPTNFLLQPHVLLSKPGHPKRQIYLAAFLFPRNIYNSDSEYDHQYGRVLFVMSKRETMECVVAMCVLMIAFCRPIQDCMM